MSQSTPVIIARDACSGVPSTRFELYTVVFARRFLSLYNVACFPYLLILRSYLIHELSIGVLFSQFGSIVAMIGATQFPLLCFQFI